MKKGKWLILVLMAMIFIFSTQVKTEASNSVTILKKKYGTLDTNESVSYTFNVPAASKVTIKFIGMDDNDFEMGTYGNFMLKVRDESGATLFKKNYYIGYSNKNISINLEKGKYKLTFKENNDYEFEYYFYITAESTENIKTESITLNKSTTSLNIGKTLTLKPTVKPALATGEFTWKSSNPAVATVSSKGVVKAKSFGKTAISVKFGGKSAKCVVDVRKSVLELNKGYKRSFKKMLKNVSGYSSATYKSNNASVASVSSSGVIKGLKHGKAIITATIKGINYKITTYVYDSDVLVQEAQTLLKSMLKNPNSLIINSTLIDDNFVSFDYSAMNGFGGYNREHFFAWYSNGKIKYQFSKS